MYEKITIPGSMIQGWSIYFVQKIHSAEIIPISRRKAKEAADIYTSYCFEKLRKGGEC